MRRNEREYYDLPEEAGRRNGRRKNSLLSDLIRVEILLVAVIIAFLTGERIGENKAAKEAALFYSSEDGQYYGAYDDDGQKGYVSGEGTEREENQNAEGTGAGQPVRTKESDAKRLEALWEEHPELLLVNKDHKLPDDYDPDLKKLPDGTNRADALAYDALVKMLRDSRKEGLALEICSSYRTVERQKELLDEDIRELMRKGYTYNEAYEEATKETMPPGYSEHSTGLAFDIVALSYQMLDGKQQNTAENKWLREHCAEYGFILRYPSDKEDVTQISYEAWHFRYVGEEAAEYIMENKIVLEEYLEEYLNGELDILD